MALLISCQMGYAVCFHILKKSKSCDKVCSSSSICMENSMMIYQSSLQSIVMKMDLQAMSANTNILVTYVFILGFRELSILLSTSPLDMKEIKFLSSCKCCNAHFVSIDFCAGYQMYGILPH